MCGTETFPHWGYATWDATRRLPYVIGDFVWTALDYLGEAGLGQVTIDQPLGFFAQYPYHLANCGDFDVCGFKRPQSYYRDILWGVRTKPFIAVFDPQHYGKQIHFSPWGWEPVIASWTFPGWEGYPTQVEVYSASDEVELLLNGISLGRQPAGAAQQNKARFSVTYQPGTLLAVAYSHDQEAGRTALATASAPSGLRLTPDREKLACAYGDLAYVTIEIIDAHGALVTSANHTVSCAAEGAGELIALGSADPLSEELYTTSRRKAWYGRLMAVVRTTSQAGEIRLKASAEGLQSAEARLLAE
jgi:beta-galactosidase